MTRDRFGLGPSARRRATGRSDGIPVVVRDGYHPDVVRARAGTPVRLAFRREESASSSESVVLPQLGRFAVLPEGETVVIDCGALEAGEYDFLTPGDTQRGRLLVR